MVAALGGTQCRRGAVTEEAASTALPVVTSLSAGCVYKGDGEGVEALPIGEYVSVG
jgi:hypothetical protein